MSQAINVTRHRQGLTITSPAWRAIELDHVEALELYLQLYDALTNNGGRQMRCKMNLRSIENVIGTVGEIDSTGKIQQKQGPVCNLAFYPVYHQGNPEHENSKYWGATPGGELKLQVVNAAAVSGLVVGAEYYVDIKRAE